ncbi:MAG TPA: M48 family metallopeptidase [Bryobacteraceae bacterium]|nr:M48 family metallopeptidase [Bryobacteraceae bacterium]
MGRYSVVLLVVLLAVSAARAKDKKKDPTEIGNREVGKGLNFYSLEKEMALGKQLAEEVQRESKLIADPIITEYVNRVGQNLVRNSDARVPFTFKMIEDQTINAFALPGGYVFVNSGLLRVAETEAELAGAMAHEIAHVAARHSTRQASRAQLANLAATPLIFLGGWTGYAVRQGAGAGIPLAFLKFERGFESEADFLGLQYMYAAGYDPTASIDIFERLLSLQRTRPGALSKVFSTHPMNEERIQKTQQEIQEILPPKAQYVVNTSEYVAVRTRLFSIENQQKAEQSDDGRPRLRTNPPSGAKTEENGEEHPTIRRRDLVD